MLDIEVVPELALRHKTWEFILGMPIQQVISILRAHDNLIRAVDFWYDDKSPFSSNLVVVLPGDGLRFYFDPFLQRLRLIEVFDLSKITLRYWSQYFNSPTVLPSVQEILRIFGSTKPLIDTGGEFRLCYRGITFFFKPLDATAGDCHPSTKNSSECIYSAPSKTSQSTLIVSRLFIYIGTDLREAKVPLDIPSACYLHNVFLDRLEIIRSETATKQLRFHLVTQDLHSSLTREPQIRRFVRSLSFGDSVQDVLSALGSPSRIFYKTEDKMKIHLPQSFRLKQPRRSDYFFNYFTLGVDILFDARYHQVIKFVLHTNQPNEYSFNTYYRCMFELPLPASSVAKDTPPSNDENLTVETTSSAGDRLVVNPFVKWATIRKRIDKMVDVEPVVIHRDAKPLKNPFGPTHAYGYQDIIFEVIPAHDYLASITLYAPANEVSEE